MEVGVVGCGRMADRHARGLSPHLALCWHSRTRARAEACRSRYGGEVCDTYADLLSRDAVQAVLIATPPEHHAEQVVQALRAGKSVLVEKPLCVSPAELDRIAQEAAARPGPFLMVAENYCYKPSVALLRSLLASGEIGAVVSAEVSKRTRQAVGGWRRGYGALLEGGVHFAALVDELFGVPPLEVRAVVARPAPGAPERSSETCLTYPGGASARLRYAWDVPSLPGGLLQHSRIRGRAGRIVFESNGLYVWLRGARRCRVFVPGVRDLLGYRGMWADFLGCLRDRDRQPYADLARARRALEIVFRAYGQL
jgi:predicted dehydrogenase